ncbi:hypothetical protein V3N80_19020 [Raoultella planticola]|nr:hypothetical protein [Raoultella planticola]HED2587282.1 hypothetical protein [Raoultella planticola]
MHTEFYLPRTLCFGKTTYKEAELLASCHYIIVLAEPGGGKTWLLDSLARQLQTRRITASVFRHKSFDSVNVPIVIDAFDEIAKVDPSGIYQLLAKASDSQPSTIVLSSRSSEWDEACTKQFSEFFGCEPLVVHMTPFNEAEQQLLFENHVSGEDFKLFQSEVARFELDPLLPNPQFLRMFADAYIESGRQFINKSSIFELAVDRLAKESNPDVSSKKDLPFEKKVEFAEEVFAKLLLSGAEGVSSSDINSERLYPRLKSLIADTSPIESILATRLFRPGDKTDQHTPVHKIVAEYCAAKYLTKRLTTSTNRLSLSLCLSIIAPNATVRDELRGLVGWLAALGNQSIQEAVIDLDPYAVLANGDPSRLLASTKRRLLQQLQKVAEQDPYFRRSDIWRTFSAAGFFTEDVVVELNKLLNKNEEHGHLRGLLLELLEGSKAIPFLANTLQQLALSSVESEYIRELAYRCLLEVENYDHGANIDTLVAEASATSLEIAVDIINKQGINNFNKPFLANFLHVCEKLYPNHKNRPENVVGKRYFIKRFISNLDLEIVEWLLDNLTYGLICNCKKESYECDCRTGISKIVGTLLDRFFELSFSPFKPERIWQWTKNLNFHGNMSAEQSLAVRILQEDDVLR